MMMRKDTERGRKAAGRYWPAALPSAASRQRSHRVRRALAWTVGAALMFAPAVASGKDDKRQPCDRHTADTTPTKAACLKAYKRQRARARMAWPPNPTVREVRVRVDRIGGPGTYAKAWRVARCETGARPRWYLGPRGEILGRYVSMMGMFHRTWAYGARRTGYDGSTAHEQIANAVAAWPITRGWSGWGCGGA